MGEFPGPGLLQTGDRSRLVEVLGRSRSLGFLGPGSIEDQIERSLGLLPALLRDWTQPEACNAGSRDQDLASTDPAGPQRQVHALDLGSGGGLPGLVLALALPMWRFTFLDGSVKRAEALARAVTSLDLKAATVVAERAEDAARTSFRGSFDAVIARGFAAAAPTAECAAPFLRVGGRLVVTEPPGGAPARWPAAPLAELGLIAVGRTTSPVAAQVLQAVAAAPDRYPRRTGIPVKRPLWD